MKVRHDRVAKDPDLQVQEAIGFVFRKFAEFESVRQVHLWLRQEGVRLPSVATNDDDAAERLDVSTMTVLRLIGDGTLVAQQVCQGTPWAIPEEQIVALADETPSGRRSQTANSAQEALDFQ